MSEQTEYQALLTVTAKKLAEQMPQELISEFLKNQIAKNMEDLARGRWIHSGDSLDKLLMSTMIELIKKHLEEDPDLSRRMNELAKQFAWQAVTMATSELKFVRRDSR